MSETPRINFVVAGVQKGGTQALRHFLSQHPEIGLVAEPKIAPHFFDYDEFFVNGPDYQTYHSWYSAEDLQKITGDITPIYTYWHGCMKRIKAYNPDMKMIVLLRNPVSRAYSHWNMEFSRGDENEEFLQALRNERQIYGAEQHRVYSYLRRGFYSDQIKNLLAHFPREQCLFIKSESMKQDHQMVMKKILDFIGASSDFIPEPETIHARRYQPMPAWLKILLRVYYWRDIKKVEALTGLDLRDWRW